MYPLATDAVDISGIPQAISDVIGISLSASYILCSVFLILGVVCVVAIFTRDKLHLSIFVLMGITAAMALGWLHYFVLIFACLIVALLYATAMRKMLSGG